MSEESVMSSSVRDITESTEAEGRDDTHQPHVEETHVSRSAGPGERILVRSAL
jgi:hypothetical protein